MSMIIMDIAIFFVGLYLARVAYGMMKTKKINKMILPEEEIFRCKDKEAFVTYIAPRMFVFSILTIVASIIGWIFDLMDAQGEESLFGVIIFLAALVIFYMQFNKAKKMFF